MITSKTHLRSKFRCPKCHDSILPRRLSSSRAPPRQVTRANPPKVAPPEREIFIENLLVRIHFNIVMMRWTGLAPWEFEFPFPGSLTSTRPKVPLQICLTDLQKHAEREPPTGVVKRFPGGLVFKAHRLLYHSTLGLRVIKKKKKYWIVLEFIVHGNIVTSPRGWCQQVKSARGCWYPTRWTTEVSLTPDSGVLRDQIYTT